MIKGEKESERKKREREVYDIVGIKKMRGIKGGTK